MKRRKLYKHPHSGILYARIQKNGITKRFSLGRNERKAHDKLKKVEKDIASGKISFGEVETSKVVTDDGRKDIHIKELAYEHLNWVKANRAEGTFQLRQHYVLRLLDFTGDCMVSSVTRETIEDFYNHCRENFSKSKNGGNEALRHVKSMFHWAKEHDVCDCNIRRFPKTKTKPTKTKRFTDDELGKLIPNLVEDFRDVLVFGLLTGLRPQELRMLKKDNLLMNGNGGYLLSIEYHKTSESSKSHKPRTVPLTGEATKIVLRQIGEHPNDDYLFLDGKGKPYTKNGLAQRLKRACLRSGIEPRSPYGLRHTFGTVQAASGTNQSILAQLMGHSHLQTTDRYVANVDDAHEQAVQAMEDNLMKVIGGGDGSPSPNGEMVEFPKKRARRKAT